jgi:hypothetical protein
MNGSSFSIATTAFVSLAICAIISYGVFYYFKQRLSLIEQSQMEQARILQAIISRGLQPQHQPQQATQQLNSDHPAAQCHKEITITQNSLIEVSSDEESETDSESESSDTESESGSDDKWSIGDEIHQSDAYHKEFNDMSERMRALSSEKKQIHIDENIENVDNIDDIEIENIETNAEHNAEHNADDTNTKKIISLKSALTHEEHESDDEDSSSSSSESESESEEKTQDFELKIGYKSASASGATNKAAVHLNYGNMSVPALRQLAKERGLGGDEGDLQKLKKKDLVQLLQ